MEELDLAQGSSPHSRLQGHLRPLPAPWCDLAHATYFLLCAVEQTKVDKSTRNKLGLMGDWRESGLDGRSVFRFDGG